MCLPAETKIWLKLKKRLECLVILKNISQNKSRDGHVDGYIMFFTFFFVRFTDFLKTVKVLKRKS